MPQIVKIRDEFKREDITEDQIQWMDDIRIICSDALDYVEAKLGKTRYSALCKIKLEEFCMFANKGIAKLYNPPSDKE